MPRRTDSSKPADWLWIAAMDLSVIEHATKDEIGFLTCRSKLAEVLEKTIKAELLRLGWKLVKTHDLMHLVEALVEWKSELASPARPLCRALAEV